jgi:hypothetical protein
VGLFRGSENPDTPNLPHAVIPQTTPKKTTPKKHQKINLKEEEKISLPASWYIRTSEGTPTTTFHQRKNHTTTPVEIAIPL